MKQHFGTFRLASLAIVILLAAACKPFGNNETADPLPTLNGAEVQAVADAGGNPEEVILLPTLVPYPTQDSTVVSQQQVTQQQQESFDFQNTDATVAEVNTGGEFPFGDVETFEFSDDSNGGEGFAPPGVTADQIGTGGSLNEDFPFADDFPGNESNLGDNPFGDDGSFSNDSPFGDSSGGGDFGNLPFDPDQASSGSPFGDDFPFGDDSPFGSVTLSRYYVSAEQPVSLFACPETSCDVIGSLDSLDPLDIINQVGEWVEINYQGSTAWVYSGFVGQRTEEEMNQSQFPFGDSDFPFDQGGPNNDDFPFGNNNSNGSTQGNSAQVGQYSSNGRFSVGGSGFSVGSNALYDEPVINNGNGNDFPWDDDFPFDNGYDQGTDCPPFLDPGEC